MKKKLLITMLIIFNLFLYVNTISAADISTDGSFEKETVGANASELSTILDNWNIFDGTASGSATVQNDNANNYLKFATGVYEMWSFDPLKEPYTFSVDARFEKEQWVAFFIRSGISELRFPFYELDRNIPDGIGGSGIAVHLLENKIRIKIKNQVTTGSGAGSVDNDFSVPDGYDIKKFTNIKMSDDGKIITIKINEKVIATVEMSNPGTYDGDDDYLTNTYYKTAVLKDASGKTVCTVNNARLASEECYAAIGIRSSSVDLDNLSIITKGSDTSEKPVTASTSSQNINKTSEATIKSSPTSSLNKVINNTSTAAKGSDPENSGTNNLARNIIIISIVGIILIGTSTFIILKLKRK